MHKLKDITLVAVATTEVEATTKAIEYSLMGMRFERTLLFSHYNPVPDCSFYDYVQIGKFPSVGDWGKFIVFDLHRYIETRYIILIHPDGFIVHPESWDHDFLNYDYVGAPWPLPKDSFSYRDYFGNIIRVGNSVSLRSHRLLSLPTELGLVWAGDHGFFHEDGFLCVQHRHTLQSHSIRYAPLSVACKFSREKPIPENRGVKPFAFHKWQGENSRYPRFTSKPSLGSHLAKGVAKLMDRMRYAKNH